MIKKKLIHVDSKPVKTLHYISLLLLLGLAFKERSIILISGIKCLNSRVYYICLFFLFKSIPTERPSLVQPTLNKIDVEALKRDLKKFEEHYPVRVSRAWAQWLQDIDKLLELPNHLQWPLDILKRCPKVQRPASEDITVPDHLQAMRDKETVETQQVCFLFYSKWCLVHVCITRSFNVKVGFGVRA